MRALGLAATTVLTLVASGLAGSVAVADDTVPSRQDVQDARTAVRVQTEDVSSVRARLVVANQQLERSGVAAAQAAEAYNGARWQADKARKAAAEAQDAVAAAEADVERQRRAYTDSVVTSYEMAPELTALSAVVRSDGIDTVIQRLKEENINISGGRLEEGSQRFLVRTVNQFVDLEEIRNLLITTQSSNGSAADSAMAQMFAIAAATGSDAAMSAASAAQIVRTSGARS